mgnify:CR=1 FL=1
MPRNVTTTRQVADLTPLGPFADVVQAFLGGTPISIIMNRAADGTAILDVLSPDSEIDPPITAVQIQTLATNYVKPAPKVDPLDALADALAAGATLAQLKTAFVAWVNSERAFTRRGRDFPQSGSSPRS